MEQSELWFLSTIAARTAVVLLALLVGLRIFGRRDVGGMNVFDLALVLLLANAIQNAMTNGSGLLAQGIVSATVLLVGDRLLGILFVQRPLLERVFVGTPVIVVKDGHLETANLRRLGVTEDEIKVAMRSYGLTDLSDVRLAVLEADGSISVVPRSRCPPSSSRE